MVVNEGLNYILNSAMPFNATAVARETNWYLVPYTNSRTVQLADTMANLAAYGEITQYDEASRREIVLGGPSSAQIVDNHAASAEFTFNAGLTLRGFMVTTGEAKGATTGILLSAQNIAPERTIVNGDQYAIRWSLALANAA